MNDFFSNLIPGGMRSLRPYEDKCLAHLRRALSPEEAEILKLQIAGRRLIQRSMKDRLVSFWFSHDSWNRLPLFPNRDAEVHFARLHLSPGEGPLVRCEAVLH